MIYRLNGKLRLGKNNKLFKKGNITKKPDGTFDVQLAIVCSIDGDIPKSKLVWSKLKTSESGVKIGISDTINCPMNSEKANFTSEPKDAFKMKVNLSLNGWVKIEVEIEDNLLMEFEFTGQDASDFVDGVLILNELDIIYIVGEDIPEVPPEIIPDEDIEPIEEITMNWYQKAIKKMQDFFLKNKWYVTGIYTLILIGLGIWNLPVTIIAWILGIIGGTYLNK